MGERGCPNDSPAKDCWTEAGTSATNSAAITHQPRDLHYTVRDNVVTKFDRPAVQSALNRFSRCSDHSRKRDEAAWFIFKVAKSRQQSKSQLGATAGSTTNRVERRLLSDKGPTLRGRYIFQKKVPSDSSTTSGWALGFVPNEIPVSALHVFIVRDCQPEYKSTNRA